VSFVGPPRQGVHPCIPPPEDQSWPGVCPKGAVQRTGGVRRRGHKQGVLRADVQMAGEPPQQVSGPHPAPRHLLHRNSRHRRLRDLPGDFFITHWNKKKIRISRSSR
jgi:hypothetical protein